MNKQLGNYARGCRLVTLRGSCRCGPGVGGVRSVGGGRSVVGWHRGGCHVGRFVVRFFSGRSDGSRQGGAQ